MLSRCSTVKCRAVTFAKIKNVWNTRTECCLPEIPGSDQTFLTKKSIFLGSRVDMVVRDDNGDGDYYKLLCNSITKQYLLAGFIIRLSGY